MEYDTNKIKEILKSKGIKPTIIRVKVLEYLIKNDNHPNAEKIFKELLGYIPTLSLTSIYNTLKLFSEKNIIQTIIFNEDAVIYDGNISNHGHFRCLNCKKIYDFPINENLLLKELPIGRIIEQKIFLVGICNNCLKKLNKEVNYG